MLMIGVAFVPDTGEEDEPSIVVLNGVVGSKGDLCVCVGMAL